MKPKRIVTEEYERLKNTFSGTTEEIQKKLMDDGYQPTGKITKLSPFTWGKDVDLKKQHKGGRFHVTVKGRKVRLNFDTFDPDRVHELPVHLLYDSYQLMKGAVGKGRKNYLEFNYED